MGRLMIFDLWMILEISEGVGSGKGGEQVS